MITFSLYNVPVKYCRNGIEKQSLNNLTLKTLKPKAIFKGIKRMNFSLKRPMEPKISGDILENFYFQIHFAFLTCMFPFKTD